MTNNGQWCVSYSFKEENDFYMNIRFIRAEQLDNHKRRNECVATLLSKEVYKYFDTHEEAIQYFNKLINLED